MTTSDQAFILALLAVIVTPLINYFIASQTAKATRAAAADAVAAAREAAAESRVAGEFSKAAVSAANHQADKFDAMQGAIHKTLEVVKRGNGPRIAAAEEKVDEAAALAKLDPIDDDPQGTNPKEK